MRVLVNLLWLRPGQVGGSENYLARLLAGAAADHDLHLAVQPPFAAAHPALAAAAEMHTARRAVETGRPARLALESTWLPRLASRLRADVVHHAGGTVPPRTAAPSVLTVHDLQYLAFPEFFSPLKRAYLRRAVPASVRRAGVIATPSQHAAGMIVASTGADPGRVRVVPHGIDPPPPGDPAVGPGVDGPFVLYPAVTWPHKNHAVLLAALARLDAARAPRLVLTGASGTAEQDVMRTAERLGVLDRLVRLGRVPEARLDALYRHAAALVFPSRFEGFGAPVVEAWHRDCPVIASTAASLPEVVGPAGLMVDPDDADGWAAGIERIADPGERRRLVEAGRRRAATFSVAAAVGAQVGAWQAATRR